MEGITSVKDKTFFSRLKEFKSKYHSSKESIITALSLMKGSTREFGNEGGIY